jgi:23S rRNA U2552 (ribose-2'-O)-methylase RlmE/FtsJ
VFIPNILYIKLSKNLQNNILSNKYSFNLLFKNILVYLSKMKELVSNIESLQNKFNTLFVDNDFIKNLSFEQIDEFITYKHLLTKTMTWQEKIDEKKKFKDHYINLLNTDEEKINAILFWKDSEWANKIELNNYIDYLITYITTKPSNAVYDIIWDFISSGKIVFDDVSNIPLEFIKYNYNRNYYRNTQRIILSKVDDEENDYDFNKVKMQFKERFWINILASRNDIDQNAIMICLSMDVNQRLKYFPFKVTKFEGELISQVTSYYNTVSISPIIKYRRNIGVILNNSPNEFYEYSKLIEHGPFYCTSIYIEMPYMCYLYVDYVEIDIIDNNESKNISLSIGDDYIIKEFREVEKNQTFDDYIIKEFRKVEKDQTFLNDFNTYKKECTDKQPGYYLCITNHIFKYTTFKNIRIYGKAISLC